MPKIYPFRALHFNPNKVKFEDVVTQPYDKINDEAQENYYKKSPYNIVSVIKAKEKEDDNETNNKYTRAAENYRNFLKDEILIQDEMPAIYAYYQIYKNDKGEEKTRKAFVSLLKLEEFGENVHAHEKTLPKPKQDRFALLTAMDGTFIEQIFMLYSDPELIVNKICDEVATSPPLIETKDESGEIHKVWPITEPEKIKVICNVMKNKDIFIADGHHRYETAVNYMNAMKKTGRKCEGNETFENFMITFVNMDDEGLTIFPTHRLVRNLENVDYENMLNKLGELFEIKEYPVSCKEDEDQAWLELQEDLRFEGIEAHSIGLVIANPKKFCLLKLKDDNVCDKLITEKRSSEWKRLDVSILHSIILEPVLGLTPEKVESEGYIKYIRYFREARKEIESEEGQMVFLINPCKVSDVKKIAAKGERMPQKSTDFYPKLLSGLLGCKLNWID